MLLVVPLAQFFTMHPEMGQRTDNTTMLKTCDSFRIGLAAGTMRNVRQGSAGCHLRLHKISPARHVLNSGKTVSILAVDFQELLIFCFQTLFNGHFLTPLSNRLIECWKIRLSLFLLSSQSVAEGRQVFQHRGIAP